MKDSLQIHYSKEPLHYDGTQLRSHWIYERFQILGDALVGFEGRANVSLDDMVDLEDVQQKGFIYSPRMLHFIGEWFTHSLETGIQWQYWFCLQVYSCLLAKGIPDLSRRGNDLFYQGRKLSVSIATQSPVSTLVHFGINIETNDTPVPTAGLAELSIAPDSFAQAIMETCQQDAFSMRKARWKVRPVD